MTYRWEGWKDDKLLDTEIFKLDLRFKQGSLITKARSRLYRDLNARDLKFKPHIWISDDWFSPDGNPGFALPFFIVHPRLRKLARQYMVEVEGGNEDWCIRLMRHETGHALDNAFGLRRRKERQKLFGLSSTPYPKSYSPKPYSRQYVVNLDSWYAQAHPDEDWAETFAVWLNPRSSWRTRYPRGIVRAKLDYLDEVMTELAGQVSPNKKKSAPEDVGEMGMTLREFFEEKRQGMAVDGPYFFDRDLLRVFSKDDKHKFNPRADRFLREHRKDIRLKVAKWSGHYQYAVNNIISELTDRCAALDLHLRSGPRQAKLDVVAMLSARTASYLASGEYEIYL